MTGKVKCTCGWSWNKSDSSKKDMYVCHECGRDNSNNMKNGGWLDNYNDSQASAPEGMIGDGFSNVGRNSSPAWGGQFQLGGSVYPVNYVPEAQTGGSFPGATGFSYARTGAPSEGKYAKKTLPSAQNGQEMKYYQEGLDWQPKTISKNGAWLDNYDKAQNGEKKFKLKDERDLVTKPSESTNVKKKNFDLEQSKSNKTYINQLAEQQKENKRRKTLTQDQREREDYNARNEQTGSIQKPVEESKWDRTKAIVSNPLTAFGYAARNESLPTRFQHGERNTLDNVIDWINPLQGIAAASEIPGELGRGEYLNAGLSALDAIDLGVYAKGAMKASKPLLNKAGKALGTESGLLSNAYKLNPYAFKPNESNWYRQVGKSAVDDVLDTGLVREAGEEVSPRMWGEFQDQIKRLQGDDALPHFEKMKQQMLAGRRPVAPFFNKGELFYPMGRKPVINKTTGKLSKNPAGAGSADYLIETALPNESFQPAYVKGMSLGVPEEIGSTAILKPNPELRNLENFNLYKKNWLQGYKQVPKKEDGGIIKDDRGQWDHPGEITEIESNEITMEGVPYDVLGISDTGDTKLMKPGKNYKFKGKKVTEYPMAQNGLRQEQKGLQNLDNLTNFTNYNTKQPGGWLDTL